MARHWRTALASAVPFARYGKSGAEISTLFPHFGQIADDICSASNAKPEYASAAKFFAKFRDLTAGGFYTTPVGMKDIARALRAIARVRGIDARPPKPDHRGMLSATLPSLPRRCPVVSTSCASSVAPSRPCGWHGG